MNKRRLALWGLLLALLLCAVMTGGCAQQAVTDQTVYALLPGETEPIRVNSTLIINADTEETQRWLFLPAFADLNALRLFAGGQACRAEWSQVEEAGALGCELPGGETLHMLQSENLRALFFFSDDPVNQGRAWLEDCKNHERSLSGSMALVDTNGAIDHAGGVRKLRGRGNSTWKQEKRPYQMKLEDKTDLLKTGEPGARTWVLLAEALDESLLHNRITFDLGLELGLGETAHSEFVDFYFDSEYRGTYLLCEKTEIGEGRVEEVDYEKLVEKWNRQAGITDMESLPTQQGENRLGQSYAWVEGLAEMDDPTLGAYLVELDGGGDPSERCWFTLSNGARMVLKNPESATESMARYISERMEEALNTLQNRGLNPQNGRTLEEDFDVDAFARSALIHELSYNIDGFTYASCFFVLPAGETRFRPGPLWDFDQAWRERVNGDNTDGVGVKGFYGWPADFYSVPVFQEKMEQIYREELYPMLRNILLGREHGRYLKPLDEYAAEIAASRRMNDRLYVLGKADRLICGGDVETDLAYLRTFIDQRSQWLQTFLTRLADCGREPVKAVNLMAFATFTQMEDTFLLRTAPWSNVQLSDVTLELETEATEEAFAVWRVEATVAPPEGFSFDTGVYVTINDRLAECQLQPDGTLHVAARLQDLSYRTVDYDGDDVGYVFDYDFYVKAYSDIAGELEYDREALLDDFFLEGVYQKRAGNGYFTPDKVKYLVEGLADNLGDAWDQYYWEFIDVGVDEGWTRLYSAVFRPRVVEEKE